MRLPLATVQDLQDELDWVAEELTKMDSRDPVNVERWENRRESLLDHQADVMAQITGDAAAAAFTRRATALTAASTMICLKPTPDQAALLALDAGEPAENLHVTLCYLGERQGPLTAVVDALRPVALTHAPLAGTVGGAAAFMDMGDGYPVIVIPDVPGLVELRVAVTQALVAAGVGYARSHGYCAHMTLQYAQDPGLPLAQALTSAGQPLSFGDLMIVRGDTEVIPLPLATVQDLQDELDWVAEELTNAG